ncbi:glycosyltransferase family 4 protein [Planctomycetaceae bacterium SH139]
MIKDTVTPAKVAYVVKRYPRFSETFVVNEILAHEAVGLPLEIFSLRPPSDTHFQDLISKVKSPLTYLSNGSVRAEELWKAVAGAARDASDLTEAIAAIGNCTTLDVYCGFRLARFVRERGISHLHAHFASSAATVTRIASKLTGLPYSITAHAKDIFHEEVCEVELGEKLADANRVLTVSKYNVAHLSQRFPQAADRINLLYNGIHLNDFPFSRPDKRSRTVLAVGRFVEKKGFDVLLRACRLLVDRDVNFQCLLVGSGECESQLRTCIDQLALHHYVKFVGAQPQAIVKQMIRSASVLAAPCVDGSDGNRDGLPTVLLEAMALGTPCISTNVTGIPELVRDGETGLLIPQRDAVALADALTRCLDDAALRVRLATNANRLIQEQFNAITNAEIQRQLFCSHATRLFQGSSVGDSANQPESLSSEPLFQVSS